MNHLPYLVNRLVVVKNQVLAQVMNQARDSPPTPTSDHHQNTCLMTKGMNSDVSDDDSDSPSIDELLDLVHEHQKVIKKQSKEIKNLSALKDLNASLATNFEDLMCKFKLLSKEHEELKLKFESINDTNNSLELKQTIPCVISISRIDASTSCIDLIDEPCSKLAMRNAMRMLL